MGCFENQITGELLKKLIQMLDDRFLQVRTSVCVALGLLGNEAIKSVMPKLMKSLKDGSINRDVVCETVMMSDSGL